MIDPLHVQRVRFVYKTILRLHRGLPPELSNLGTSYVKDEFKRHKDCDPATAVKFITGWTDYAVTLAKQLGVKGPKTGSKIGVYIDEKTLDDMNAEQIVQLYELMKATKNEGNTSLS